MNPFTEPLPESKLFVDASEPQRPRQAIGRWRAFVAALLILNGCFSGIAAMLLVSNRFGNTDVIGLAMLCIAGWSAATGIALLRLRFLIAALIGLIASPVAGIFLCVLFWIVTVFSVV
ncbi:MAG: hypothetical protein AAFX06_29500 [Planctomycetota bacterium]